MKFFIVLSAVAAVALAKPSHLLWGSPHNVAEVASPWAWAAPQVHVKLVPGAPIGHDGRVVDTPEVAHAKAEHNAAHVNEKITLAHEAVKSADVLTYAAAPSLVASSYLSHGHVSLPYAPSLSYHEAHPVHHAVAPVVYTKLVPAAPLGHDGRVVDTPEVAHAKLEHNAAHVNERITLAHEEAKSSHYAVPLVSTYSSGSYAPQYYGAHHSAAPLVKVW